jgi:hypothetical protein
VGQYSAFSQFGLLDRAPYTSVFLSEDTSSSLNYLHIFIAFKVSENMDSFYGINYYIYSAKMFM